MCVDEAHQLPTFIYIHPQGSTKWEVKRFRKIELHILFLAVLNVSLFTRLSLIDSVSHILHFDLIDCILDELERNMRPNTAYICGEVLGRAAEMNSPTNVRKCWEATAVRNAVRLLPNTISNYSACGNYAHRSIEDLISSISWYVI